MKLYFELLAVAAMWVFVLDISGFWNEASSAVKRVLTKGAMKQPFQLKPFSCSLCMTFWTGLVYLLIVGRFTLPMVAFVCLAAYLTPRIKDLLLAVDMLLAAMFNKIFNVL